MNTNFNRTVNFIIVRLLPLGLLLISCGAPKRLDLRDLSYLYHPERFTITPEAIIACNSPNSVNVIARLAFDNFLPARKNDDADRSYQIMIRAKIFLSDLRQRGGDSLSFAFQESYSTESNADSYWRLEFNLPFSEGKRGLVELVYIDLNRHVSESRFYYIDRSKNQNACDFVWKEVDTSEFLYTSYTDNPRVIIQPQMRIQGEMTYSYYPPVNHLAPAPMATSSDGIPALVPQKSENVNPFPFFIIQMEKPGIYELKSNSGKGSTLFKFDKGFPDVKTVKALLEPLQYLCSEEEYASIKTAQNQKNAIDAFWLKCASTEERAVQFIKLYYGRIRQSNLLFTSYVEGWKSDRGLIYTMFGPPDNVFRQLDEETWFYTESDSRYQVSFRFLRVGNPFTDNDFELERNGTYRTVWFQQIDNWRNGRIPLTTRTLR